MGMLTSARVEIAAHASDVFSWLVEPAKLTAWLGGPGGMPEDAAALHVGWKNTADQGPVGAVTVEITGYEPPARLEYRSAYTGGDALTRYRLVEGEGITTLTVEGDTDWARPEGAWDSALEGQPEAVKDAVQAQFETLEQQLEAGRYDSMAQQQMQQSLEASLQKLKGLIEAG